MIERNNGRRASDMNPVEFHEMIKSAYEHTKRVKNLHLLGSLFGFMLPFFIRGNWEGAIFQSVEMGTDTWFGAVIVPGNVSAFTMLIAGTIVGFGIQAFPSYYRKLGIYGHFVFASSVSSAFAWFMIIFMAGNALNTLLVMMFGTFVVGILFAYLINSIGTVGQPNKVDPEVAILSQ